MPEQPIRVRLLDLAGQENCDGEPFDTMVEAAKYIGYLEGLVSRLQDEVVECGWRVERLEGDAGIDPVWM